MSSPKKEKREVDSIIECAEKLKCENLTIITNSVDSTDSPTKDRVIEKKGHTITVVPINEF